MRHFAKVTSLIALASSMGWAATAAMAVPNGPAGQAAIMHCGCNAAGNGMQYTEITVNSKSRGHDAHVAGTIDSCFDGVETYTDVIRMGNDCQLSGPPLGDPIESCVDPVPVTGDDCGELPIQ
jgi:hypothetical protein